MTEIDILHLDTKIRNNFFKEFEKLPSYENRIREIAHIIENEMVGERYALTKSYDMLLTYIDELTSKSKYHFYIAETLPIIEKYKNFLNTPIRLQFMGKQNDKQNNIEKKAIISSFFKACSPYIRLNIDLKMNTNYDITCLKCGKRNFDIEDDTVYTCLKCYTKQYIMKHNSCYNDIERINISNKYTYDRKIHFRDCIKQYQGKQNCTIDNVIYKELEDQFNRHCLIDTNATHKKDKFKKVTKKHILIFLKELGYSKHYENVHLMHYNFTGVKPDDISYLEDKLMDDFDLLSNLYDKMYKNINRKNFINTQYVVYQLLCRHKHKCAKEDFIILKTTDRKFFHDEVCKNLFMELGWNHSPFF